MSKEAYDKYFDELMNNKEKREAYFKKEKEMWDKKPNRNIKFKLTPGQIDSLIGLKIIKENKSLKSRASKCFTNPGDALIAFRELIKRKEEVESKNGIE